MIAALACGPKNASDGDAGQEGPDAEALQPNASASERTLSERVRFEGTAFDVSLLRKPAKEAPIVIDEIGTPFYDNDVYVSIKGAGSDSLFFSRHFTKADFQAYVPETAYKVAVLQGMNLSDPATSPEGFMLTAQVGEPGLEGEGATFSVCITRSGNVVIKPIENTISLPSDEEELSE